MKTGRYYALLGVLFMMTACSATSSSQRVSLVQNQNDIIVRNGVHAVQLPSSALNAIAPAAGRSSSFVETTLSYKGGNALSSGQCRLKDRFDRKELVAYNFSDGQSRVGLKLNMDGFGLSDAGRFDVRAARLNFSYRLQPIKKKQERCLYQSSWQGLVGSGYNEFFMREDETVFEIFDEEMNLAYGHVESFFDF